MFWGLIMEPHRRYTQKVKKSFHISMAALDQSTSSDEPAQVMCGFEGRNYLLCTLKKPNDLQCPLDLNFNAGSEVSFAANGKCHIHLTGYLNDDEELIEEENEEEEGEEEKDQNITKSKRNCRRPEEKERITQKKSKNGIAVSNQFEEEEEDSDDADYINTLLGKSLEDDDEESSASVEEEENNDEDSDEEEEESEDLQEEEEENDDDASSLSEADSDEEDTTMKLNGLPPTPENSQPSSQKTKKQDSQKKKKKEKQVDQSPQTKNEQKKDIKTPNKENKTPKKKSLQGGVIIEDIREGQGALAKNGKFVNVYYEGRLKQNNKLFDSTTKGAGFSFRLGNGEVIKGWDIGVAGMKIGGKRRITCPPAMAYGQKGSPPAIPPNSTLVFEVELRKIN